LSTLSWTQTTLTGLRLFFSCSLVRIYWFLDSVKLQFFINFVFIAPLFQLLLWDLLILQASVLLFLCDILPNYVCFLLYWKFLLRLFIFLFFCWLFLLGGRTWFIISMRALFFGVWLSNCKYRLFWILGLLLMSDNLHAIFFFFLFIGFCRLCWLLLRITVRWIGQLDFAPILIKIHFWFNWFRLLFAILFIFRNFLCLIC